MYNDEMNKDMDENEKKEIEDESVEEAKDEVEKKRSVSLEVKTR